VTKRLFQESKRRSNSIVILFAKKLPNSRALLLFGFLIQNVFDEKYFEVETARVSGVPIA
jgi:hypothetical protein